jgi:creatinine amidohydrolase
MSERVRWAELLPHEFLARQAALPVIYLPLGLCEPHGQIAAFGLDTIKADYLCDEAARRFGGIVAPTMGYHIHESGPALAWLDEVVGGVNPLLGGMPPALVLESFLYQLRAGANAGFRLVVAISGHNFGQQDLRIVAEEFMRNCPISVVVKSDPELVAGLYDGDHAGRYEISQLLHLRPDLVDMAQVTRTKTALLGRFALNPDAGEASATLGAAIITRSLEAIGELLRGLQAALERPAATRLSYRDTDAIWQRVIARRGEWMTVNS